MQEFSLSRNLHLHEFRFLRRSDFDHTVSDQTLDGGTLGNEGTLYMNSLKVEHVNSSSGHVMLVPVLMEVYKTVHCNSG